VVDVIQSGLIELFLKSLIQELGATGILVVGLYIFLYRPLSSMRKSLGVINEELGEIVHWLKYNVKK